MPPKTDLPQRTLVEAIDNALDETLIEGNGETTDDRVYDYLIEHDSAAVYGAMQILTQRAVYEFIKRRRKVQRFDKRPLTYSVPLDDGSYVQKQPDAMVWAEVQAVIALREQSIRRDRGALDQLLKMAQEVQPLMEQNPLMKMGEARRLLGLNAERGAA